MLPSKNLLKMAKIASATAKTSSFRAQSLRSSFSSVSLRKNVDTNGKEMGTAATAGQQASADPVKLVRIPSLPFIGSKYSPGVELMRLDNLYSYQINMHRKFGDFYSIGTPGLGVGLHGTRYILTDPTEMTKVIRMEGTYPYGGIQTTWPIIQFHKELQTPMYKKEDEGYFGRGENWKRLRTFLQTDLLSPEAARGYVPGMIAAAEVASKAAPYNAKNVSQYSALCSFDMFHTVMFGSVTTASNPTSAADPKDLEFCAATIQSLKFLVPLLFSPKEMVMAKFLGIKGKQYQIFFDNMKLVRQLGRDKILAFRDKKVRNELNEFERASYCYHAIERQMSGTSNISEDEMVDLCIMALSGAVDTTSGVLNWALIHLALNPDVQNKLYEELSLNVHEYGSLSERTLNKKKSPYLSSFLRECHRMTPALVSSVTKSIGTSNVKIHDTTIPKGNIFTLDSYSLGMNPDYVSDPHLFRPERWFPPAVKARQGTKSEVIDHPFYKQPFSQGARKCPGSRVANYEVHVLIAQLVLDWKISFDHEGGENDVVGSPCPRYLEDVRYATGATIQPVMPKFRFESRGG